MTDFTFEPIPGYSVPVVRVASDAGHILGTLSFTGEGAPLNPPMWATPGLLRRCWETWQESQINNRRTPQ